MNSMAQHAVPKGMGQIEDLRPHLVTASSVVVMMLPPPWTPAQVGSTNLPWKRSRSPMGVFLGTAIITQPEPVPLGSVARLAAGGLREHGQAVEGLGQAGRRRVLRGEQGIAHRPRDADRGIVPEDAQLVPRMVEVRALVLDVHAVGEHAEAVGE